MNKLLHAGLAVMMLPGSLTQMLCLTLCAGDIPAAGMQLYHSCVTWQYVTGPAAVSYGST